jgi:insulysin
MITSVGARSLFHRLLASPLRPRLHSPTLIPRRYMAMAASEWKTVTRDPPYSVFSKPIQKSQQDDRDYRLIRLENGLQACLIHDPKADKAAASLDVAVGHLHDPVGPLRINSTPFLTIV